MRFIPAVVLALAGLPPLPAADGPVRRYGAEAFHVPGTATAVALAPDGRRLAVASRVADRDAAVVTVFDADTGRVRTAARPACGAGPSLGGTDALAFSPDGRRVAAALTAAATVVLDADTGREVWRSKAGETNPHPFVAFDPNGRLIRGFDNETRVYDLATNQVATWPVGGIAKVTSDGKTYVRTKKIYAEVEVGDTAAGRPRHVLPLRTAHNGAENGYALSPDGRTLAVVHAVSEVHLVDLATGATRRSWALPKGTLPATNTEYATAFSPDGRALTLATPGRLLRWDLEPFAERPAVPLARPLPAGLWRATADGTALFVARPGGVERWDAATGRPLDPAMRAGAPFALTPDGAHLLAGDRDGRVGVWAVGSAAFVRALDVGPPAGVPLLALAVSPDGRHVAFNRYAGDFELRPLAEGPSRAAVPPTVGTAPTGVFLAWAPDGRHVFGNRTDVLLNRTNFVRYDREESRAVENLSPRNVLALSPDGRGLIHWETQYMPNGAFSRMSLRAVRYDVARQSATGVVPLKVGNELLFDCRAAAYSPADGTLALATHRWVHVVGAAYPPIEACDPERPARPVRSVNPAAEGVNSLAFSPNGRWLVTGGQDRAVKVWEVATGKLVRRFDGHDLAVAQVAVAGNGRTAFSAGSDGFVYEWDLTPAHRQVPKTAAGLWAAAVSADAALGTAAAWALMGDAALRADATARLKPAAIPDEKQVAGWIADLDAAAFEDRTAATRELAALSRAVEGPLRDALKATPSAEVRERLEALIARFDKKLAPDEVRAMRLVHAAEWFGAKAALTAWAAGAPSAVLTREATAALARLK